MTEEKMLKVEKIRRGTVIDHIPVGRSFQVLKILNISSDPGITVSIAIHVKSKKMGLKDVVKIEDRILDSSELNKIALIAEGATITIVEDYEVIKKFVVVLPDIITGILKCSNGRCISNMENSVKPSFTLLSKNPLTIKCHYCEREMETDEIFGSIT
ncbi:MAG: aspartate carbamoyltransferase regulatory subunit [Candidatus Thermoplasmatota archaeon]|jgi:aspartate carbamoyltransferase regulatory subunit|nr:aspartate carbamoyltransferase regulatory subunit [Candidatus Thermoplasmatota archaeon]MCL5789530.1 aspartate carbamoyltransferase regulatory subunit [Candidatus Thermoplasmatota archaeon]